MRMLILSCNTGEGHNSCARALKEACEKEGNFCSIIDALSFVSGDFSKLMSWGHTAMYRKLPELYGIGYVYSERHFRLTPDSGNGRILSRGAGKLQRFILKGEYGGLCV